MIANIFFAVGVLAVVAGGVVSAFGARRPSRFRMWASAYLVLIAGAVQCGITYGWHQLDEPHSAVAAVGFILFNIGNAGVIGGTRLKGRSPRSFELVALGSGLLAGSMALLLWSVHSANASWTLVWFTSLVLVVFVSMPLGLMFSRRH